MWRVLAQQIGHPTSKVTVHVPDVVDLDELNEDLDQLLAKDGQ